MSIDISSEQLVPISQAHQHVPGRPHKSTLWRWILKGVRGQRLETVVAGGRRFTSVEAIERFCRNLTDPSKPTPAESRLHKARVKAADRFLDAAGI
jgi:hypothetical protein